MGVKTEDGTVKEAEYLREKGVWGSGEIIRKKDRCNGFLFGPKKS